MTLSLNDLWRLLPGRRYPIPTADHREERRKRRAQRIVRRNAEGNVRLALGHYVTADDIEGRRARVRHAFGDR